MTIDRRLDSDVPEIGGRSVQGGLTLLMAQVLALAITIGSTVVLARLLTPHDFGVAAMALVLVGMVGPLKDFGFPQAVAHHTDVGHAELSRLFWLNLRLSVLLAVGMAALAPVLAWFFREPRVTALSLVLAAGVFVRGVGNLHHGLLRRRMRFRALAIVEAGSLLAGAAVGIGLAALGVGSWALIAQYVTVLVVQTLMLWASSEWRPARARERSGSTVRHAIVRYGKDTTLARMVHEVASQADRLVIGRTLGAAPLGLYQSALRWATLPPQQLTQPVKSVAVVAFAVLRHDPGRYRVYARKAFTVMLAPLVPALVFMAVEADGVVALLLGPQWQAAVPIFRWLLVAALLDCVTHATQWIYLGEGQTRRRLRWTLFATPVHIAAVVAGLPWGAVGVAAATCVAKAALVHPALQYCLRTSPLRSSDFWAAAWRSVLAALVAAAALLGLHAAYAPVGPSTMRLALHGVVFALVYLGGWLVTPGGWATARELAAAFRVRTLDAVPS